METIINISILKMDNDFQDDDVSDEQTNPY